MMSNRINQILISCLVFMFLVTPLLSQSKMYEGPDDPAGDPAAERETHMDGNRFQIYLNNTGYTGHWGYLDGSKWPRTSEAGLDLYDGLRLIIGGKVYLENDTIPVTDADIISTHPDLDSLFIIEANASSESDPTGQYSWARTPVFGYFNELAESPAISIDPFSWPTAGWPSRGDELKWPGEWNGRFGRGVQYAQLESYYVTNDAQDQEWVQEGRRVKYYPRRTYDNEGNILRADTIGIKRSEVTTQRGLPWGGLGVRVEVRGYQWNNPQTRDAVFWEYNVANISEYDLPEMIFGYMMDLGIGHYILSGDGEDDVGSFNDDLDLSYCWDINGVGNFGYPTGTLGFAFLESPGVPNDFIDNDNDGLVDEKRDNLATSIIGATEGIDNIDQFLTAYGYQSIDDLKEHWDADEDQDWNDGVDANQNGIYDSGEDYGDDIGLDGVAPGDLNYEGPDLDGTECNHMPDQLEGFGAEPNFGILDVSESDMLGLQSFRLFTHPQGASPSPQYDRDCYQLLADQTLDEFQGAPVNLYQTFGTGPFRLDKGRTERISMATIAAYEDLAGLNENRTAPLLFERKKVVQLIYESDYRFATPPEMPTIHAYASDGQVILSWDDKADKMSREPLLDGENDFEGYKLYRSTDRFFEDAAQLYDGFGNLAGLKPIKQWDLKNDYFGHTDFGLVDGEGVYLGSNTGIQHYYIDTDVQNGRTYYYYLAAYDRGIEEKEIAPAENVSTIKVDENELISFLSPNVAVATPRPKSAGYSDPIINVLHDSEDITGPDEVVSINIIDPSLVKTDHIYHLVFDTTNLEPFSLREPVTGIQGHLFVNSGLKIFDATDDTLVYYENVSHPIRNHYTTWETAGSGYGQNIVWDLMRTQKLLKTDLFDGLQIEFELPLGQDGIAQFDSINSGWFIGDGFLNLSYYGDNARYYPFQFDLIFTGEGETYTSRTDRRGAVKFGTGLSFGTSDYLQYESFNFYAEDKAHINEDGNYERLDLMAIDMNGNDVFDLYEDEIFVGFVDFDTSRGMYSWISSMFSFNFVDVAEADLPQAGDILRISHISPFLASDTLSYMVPAFNFDAAPLVEENLDDILVVPNPYVVTNTLEPAVRNNQLNQRRRLMFTNIPAKSTISIFTMSGYLVDMIEVDNYLDNGMAYWDLLTKEDLEIAPGIYLYHVKSEVSGKEKTGKFAVIK